MKTPLRRQTPLALQPNHHPDDATLVSYAAGGLATALSVTVACHLAVCPRCRQRVSEADILGGHLLTHLPQQSLSASRRQAMLEALDQPSKDTEPSQPPAPAPADADDLLPAPLRPWLGERFSDLKWSTLGPGMKQVKIHVGNSNLRLFKIAPGTCMPLHSHGGSELTLVLRGSYSDEIGRFCPGDVADLDPEVEHQPIADRDQDCICLIATDAPLRFRGIVPRLLQPFFGL
ncbi:ChrR family anti-sigma-E factor [Pokkaliibacter sp. MBI-7]|uniref:ChrR family anti-sigma-E factor n=1 Tax=Pokkaliibacter sp. MBI-7 TaxID=3040600 RepID=UPI002448A5EC|nr:ChrR family anti-sigma-E factor [Pokkaliibacter sp. MBI-7]MDH2433114.1 ChrR family anti-sigma-E factor [Pokkaliibacter sp. MBI-7]